MMIYQLTKQKSKTVMFYCIKVIYYDTTQEDTEENILQE